MLKMILVILASGVAIFFLWAAIAMTILDSTEKHDHSVSKRWAARRESVPPEWADPEKWWESEER